MIMKKQTFNEFCYKTCDGLYDPLFPDEKDQSSGYVNLKKMVLEQIKPASLDEIKRWEISPTYEEVIEEPKLKYLRFLHPLLRPIIINNWDIIKDMEI